MDKLNLLTRSADPDYHDLWVSYWIMFSMFILVVILLVLMTMTMKVTYRKSKHVYCLQLLKQSDKITDQEDLEYLKKIEPKLKGYSEKWWFNNGPTFMARMSKMKKIASKYDLEIEIWNK